MYETQKKSFEYLKAVLAKTPILSFPKWAQKYMIYTDSSSHSIEETILQEREEETPETRYSLGFGYK